MCKSNLFNLSSSTMSLSNFLTAVSNNNLNHMGLRLLSQMYKQHPKLLDDYQRMIVEYLQSKDQTLKQQTLQLLYKMTSNQNIQIILSKMLDALHASTDDFFRNTLVLKITQLCERFSPTHKWYLNQNSTCEFNLNNSKKQQQKPKINETYEKPPIIVIPPSEPKPKNNLQLLNKKLKKRLHKIYLVQHQKTHQQNLSQKKVKKKKKCQQIKVQTTDLL